MTGAAEAFFSSLEWEVVSRHRFVDTRTAQAVLGVLQPLLAALGRWHDESINYEPAALDPEAA